MKILSATLDTPLLVRVLVEESGTLHEWAVVRHHDPVTLWETPEDCGRVHGYEGVRAIVAAADKAVKQRAAK